MLHCTYGVYALEKFWLFSIHAVPYQFELSDRLKRGNAVLQAVCFNIFADTPSHPVDLLVSTAHTLKVFCGKYDIRNID